MVAGVNTAHTSAPGMLSRKAVRNGVGLVPRLVYHVTCVAKSRPQAVEIARMTHQRGYDAVGVARDSIGGVYGGSGTLGRWSGRWYDKMPPPRVDTDPPLARRTRAREQAE